MGRPPGTLRIAFTAVAPNGAPVDDDCVAAVTQAAELLESLGHSVEEAPVFADEGYVENFIKVWTAGVARRDAHVSAACGERRWTSRSSSP